MRPFDEKTRHVVAFTLLYLLPAASISLKTENWEFLYYIAVVLLLGVLILAVHTRIALSSGLLWFLSIWGLLHMAGGLLPTPAGWPIEGQKAVFYSLWIIPERLKYDQVVHAYGFGMATWVCWQAVKPTLRSSEPRVGILFLCALAGMGLGAFNEVVEFVATLFISDTNIGGYVNTGWDLVSNMIGSTTAAVLIWGVRPKTTPSDGLALPEAPR